MKKGEKTVTLPFYDHEELIKFRDTIKENNVISIKWHGGLSIGGYPYSYTSSYEEIEYLSVDKTVKKIGEANESLVKELELVDEIKEEVNHQKRINDDLREEILKIKSLIKPFTFWEKLIGAFKNRKS